MKVFVCSLLLIGTLSCGKLEPTGSGIYEWTGAFEVNGDQATYRKGCIGEFNPCNGNGEAKITLSSNHSDGTHIGFYYNGRLIKTLVAPSYRDLSLSHSPRLQYLNQDGVVVLDWIFDGSIIGGPGYFVKGFPVASDGDGHEYYNYFVRKS